MRRRDFILSGVLAVLCGKPKRAAEPEPIGTCGECRHWQANFRPDRFGICPVAVEVRHGKTHHGWRGTKPSHRCDCGKFEPRGECPVVNQECGACHLSSCPLGKRDDTPFKMLLRNGTEVTFTKYREWFND
jgi:hypothetical protein